MAGKWLDLSSPGDVSFVDRPQTDDDDVDGDTNNLPFLRPLKLKSIGNLQYVSMILGKVNREGKWCPLYDLSPKEWATPGHEEGRPWTLARMDEVRRKCDDGTLDDKPANRKGCTHESLMPAIGIIDLIIPILHIMIGMYNDALEDGLLRYIDERHERIPPEELEARKELWKAEIALREIEEEFQDWWLGVGDEKLALESDIGIWLAMKKERDPITNKFIYTMADRQEMNRQIKDAKERLQEIDHEKKTRVEDTKVDKKALKEARGILKDHRKARKKLDCQIRQDVDRILKKHGVDRGASHGGDLNGVAILIMEERIDEIITDLEALLVSNPDKPDNVTEEEIKKVSHSYRLHFRLMGNMFSLARTPKSEFKDLVRKQEILAEGDKTCAKVMESHRRLGLSMYTVKSHLCGDHLRDQLDYNDGIAEYIEDWVEQLHQFVKKMQALGNIRDLKVKAE